MLCSADPEQQQQLRHNRDNLEGGAPVGLLLAWASTLSCVSVASSEFGLGLGNSSIDIIIFQAQIWDSQLGVWKGFFVGNFLYIFESWQVTVISKACLSSQVSVFWCQFEFQVDLVPLIFVCNSKIEFFRLWNILQYFCYKRIFQKYFYVNFSHIFCNFTLI